MKRIWITIGRRVQREVDRPEDEGQVLIVDWDKKETYGFFTIGSGQKIKVGRTRGGRGIAWHEDYVYIATCEGIFAINPETYELDHVVDLMDHTYDQNLHGIRSNGWCLKVTCHGEDIVQVIRNKKVQLIYATAEKHGLRTNERPPHRENGLNAIGFTPSGEEFHLYSHRFLIYNWTRQQIAVEGLTDGPHDLCFLNDNEVLVTKSSTRELCLANVRTGEYQVVFRYSMGSFKNRDGPEYAKAGWLRGIAYHKPTESVFVMAAPGKLQELDRNTWELKDSFVFCNTDVESSFESPFDLLLDPRDWT